MSAPSSALRVSESDFGDGLTDSIAAIRIHRVLGGPKPFTNPLVRLMKDQAPPLIYVKNVDAQTGDVSWSWETDKPTAYTLLRKAKYANARAKARVATAHMRQTNKPNRTRLNQYPRSA